MMNKRVFYFCCLALPALWLTAFEQGSDADQAHGELVPISVGDLWLEGELNTRAGGTPVTQDGSTLSLYLIPTKGAYPRIQQNLYVHFQRMDVYRRIRLRVQPCGAGGERLRPE